MDDPHERLAVAAVAGPGIISAYAGSTFGHPRVGVSARGVSVLSREPSVFAFFSKRCLLVCSFSLVLGLVCGAPCPGGYEVRASVPGAATERYDSSWLLGSVCGFPLVYEYLPQVWTFLLGFVPACGEGCV